METILAAALAVLALDVRKKRILFYIYFGAKKSHLADPEWSTGMHRGRGPPDECIGHRGEEVHRNASVIVAGLEEVHRNASVIINIVRDIITFFSLSICPSGSTSVLPSPTKSVPEEVQNFLSQNRFFADGKEQVAGGTSSTTEPTSGDSRWSSSEQEQDLRRSGGDATITSDHGEQMQDKLRLLKTRRTGNMDLARTDLARAMMRSEGSMEPGGFRLEEHRDVVSANANFAAQRRWTMEDSLGMGSLAAQNPLLTTGRFRSTARRGGVSGGRSRSNSGVRTQMNLTGRQGSNPLLLGGGAASTKNAWGDGSEGPSLVLLEFPPTERQLKDLLNNLKASGKTFTTHLDALEFLRRILKSYPKTLTGMVGSLYSPVLMLCETSRSVVAKAAVVALTELASCSDLRSEGYVEQVLNCLLRKTSDKSGFVSDVAASGLKKVGLIYFQKIEF